MNWMMLFGPFLDKWKEITISALLALILLGGWQGVWVWGRVADASLADRDKQIAVLVQDRDRWEKLALASIHLTERAALPPGVVGASGPLKDFYHAEQRLGELRDQINSTPLPAPKF